LKPLLKYGIFLTILEILVLNAGYFILSNFSTGLHFSDIAILSAVFTIIALTTLIIFLRGQSREPGSQTMHTLVATGLKFLLELVLAVIWFIIAKKTGLSSVILFFVLYLTFTLFSIIIMLKTLKNKSL
jgi:hypothetical protein